MHKRKVRFALGALLVAALFLSAGHAVALDTEVGQTEVRLEGDRALIRTQETNLGNLVTDLMRAETGADIALTNGGGLRDSVEPGPITLENVLEIHPFENAVVTIELTGAEVVEALEHGVSRHPDDWGGFPHVSGIVYSFNTNAEPGSRVQEVRYQGGPIDPEATFVVATNDFLSAGGDEFTMLKKDHLEEFATLESMIISYLQENSPVAPEVEGRIVIYE